MHHFLDQYSRGMTRINKFIDLVILSLLWIVTSLPVITIGASTASAYNAVIKVTRQSRGYMWREFLFSFKDNFLITMPGLPVVLAAFAGIAYLIYQLFPYRQNFAYGIYLVFSVVLLLLVLLLAIHLFAASGRFDLTRGQLFQIAVKMTLSFPLRNLLLLFVVLGLAWITIVFWPLIFVLPGLFFLFLTYLLEPMFHRYINYPDDLHEEVPDEGELDVLADLEESEEHQAADGKDANAGAEEGENGSEDPEKENELN